MSDNELKPCPFCECEIIDVVAEEYLDGSKVFYTANCHECDTQHGGLFETYDEATKAWNTRPLEDALRAEIERLRGDLEMVEMMCGVFPTDENGMLPAEYVLGIGEVASRALKGGAA